MPLLEWIAVHWVAAILLLVYVAMLMYNALLGQRASDSISGYYLGGRRLGGFTIGVSFFATFASTNSYIGHAGKGYEYGLPWLVMAFSLVLFTYISWRWIGPRTRRMAAIFDALTLPDYLAGRFLGAADRERHPLRISSGVVIVFCSVLYLIAIFKGAGHLAALPLNYHPGEEWQYSAATNVVGHLVEIISGQSLDEFLRQRIFEPLQMPDTHFYLDNTKGGRLTTQYTPDENNKIKAQDPGSKQSRWITSPRNLFSGAGGLVSTVRDYLRFQQAMLNGGEIDGNRILAPSTVSLMLENHTGDLPLWLPGPGMGFGLGYGVVVDRGAAATPLSEGAGYWGGAYCTLSWIDPEQNLVGVLMTQVRPYSHINIRQDFQVLTYQAIID